MDRLKKLFLTSVAATSLLTSFAGSVDYEKGVPQAPVQTYTQQAQKNAPILIKGTNAEKEQLWKMYSEISATPTGEDLIQKLNETYERTGKKVTIEITDLEDGTYGAYSGGTNKITINKKYLTNLKLMNSINPQTAKSGHEVITLAHELKHFIQNNRTRNETNTTYPNLKDLYIAKKILELETCIQDVVLAAERETILQSDKKETSKNENKKRAGNEALVSMYRDLTKEGMEKYSDDAQKAKRYAKTELAKKLWENENLPLHQRFLSLFTEVQDKIAYDRINYWNSAYNDQANLNLMFSDDSKFSLKKEDATILFEEHIKEMGIDLSPNYLRENLTNFDSYGYSVKDDEIEIAGGISLELKKNKNGGVTFSRLVEGKKTTENIFDENGKCLSAQTFLGSCLIKKGNVNLGLDETHFGAGITITCDGFVTSYYSGSKQKHEVRDKDGNVLEYYAPDGKKLPTEEEFKKGKNGIFLGYDQLRNFKQIQYKNGKKEGDELYYRDGTICKKISSEGTTTTYYYKNPKQIHEFRNKDGKVIACFSPEGKSLTPEDEFKNGKDGTFLGFDQDGYWRQTTYKNGKKNGPEIQPYLTTIYKDDKMIESYENDKSIKDFPRQEEIKPLGSEKSIPKSSLKRTLTANTISKSGPAITPERQPQQKKVSVKSILPSKSEQR